MQPTDSKVLARIHGHGRGWVFTPADFLDLGSRDAVDQALSRHARTGHIRRLTWGLYDYPVDHPDLGRVAPATQAVAKALSTRYAVRLQPAGAYAANILGLSEQVPVKTVFLTDGPSRHVRIGNRDIVLKHTTQRNMATAGRKSGTIIQALRHIGQKNVDGKTVNIIDRQLTEDDRKQLTVDLKYAPGWVATALRSLVEQEE